MAHTLYTRTQLPVAPHTSPVSGWLVRRPSYSRLFHTGFRYAASSRSLSPSLTLAREGRLGLPPQLLWLSSGRTSAVRVPCRDAVQRPKSPSGQRGQNPKMSQNANLTAPVGNAHKKGTSFNRATQAKQLLCLTKGVESKQRV